MSKASSTRSTSSTDVALGRKVRAARLQCGMSQVLLAQALGITFQQVQKYEKGVNRISVSRLAAIAKVLNLPVEWFVSRENPSVLGSPDHALWRSLATDEGAKLFTTFASIENAAVRRRIVALVCALAEEAKREPDAD